VAPNNVRDLVEFDDRLIELFAMAGMTRLSGLKAQFSGCQPVGSVK